MKPIILEKPEIKGYSLAPYNFVSFPEKAVIRYVNPGELPAHNNFKNRNGDDLLSGIIEYELEAKTPIIVAAGAKDKDRKMAKDVSFFRNLDGKYAIPGNTMRGIIRTNSQILSFSNIIKADDSGGYAESEIQDSRFLFRDVAGNNALSKHYSNILDIDRNKRVSRSLKAGYMYNDNGRYYISESEKLHELRNYFRVDEIHLRKITDEDIKNEINFMYKEELVKYKDDIKELNKKMAPKNNSTTKQEKRDALRERLLIIRKCRNKENQYKPYYFEISFFFDKQKGIVTKIGKKDAYFNKGYLLSGGAIDGKLAHYIVPAPSDSFSRIQISEEDIIQYKDDLILTKKMNKATETINEGYEFFDLPARGKVKPVFLINTNRLHFGFTPYLRMFYSKSVLDGIKSSYKDVKSISYTDSIFGFINMNFAGNKYSYKSRVSFEDAVADKNAEVDKESTMEMLLAEPKPTSYNLYLKQDINKGKKELDIYNGDFEIRGIKQYWMKNYIEKPDVGTAEGMIFRIYPLKEGTVFSGRIHFKNLEEDELGLLLWALKLEDNCYQNIGLAKPYGFGRVKISDIALKIENLERKYGEFCFDFMDDADVDYYIDFYKNTFSRKYLGNANIDKQKSIEELMCIKSTLVDSKDSNWYRYMKLRHDGRNLKEFSEKRVLPSILEYADVVKKDGKNFSGKKDNYKQARQQRKDNKGRQFYSKDNKNIKGNTSQDVYKSGGGFRNTIGDLVDWEEFKNKINGKE